MIRHIVMLELNPDHDKREFAEVMTDLSALTTKIEGFTQFEHGPNRDLENKSQAYPYGFICTFDDEASLHAYAGNPEHQALGARLVAMCRGGADGIMVVDLDT